MKKIGFALSVMAVLAFAGAAFAAGNVQTGSAPGSAHTITIDGGIAFTWYYRDEAINEVLDQVGFPTFVGAPDVEEFTGSDTGYMLDYHVGLTAELADKVTGRIVIGNEPVIGTGSANIGDQFGDGFIDTMLLEGYVTVEEFLSEHLTFSIGVMDLTYDLRGNGDAFFLDLRNAESSFLSPTTEAFGGEVYAYDYGFTGAMAGSGFGGLTRTRNTTSGGWKMTYNDSDTVFVDVFAFTVAEGGNIGGAASFGYSDEAIYGINLDYLFDKKGDHKSLFSAIFTLNTADQTASKVYTIGAGIDYFWEQLELYGEIYYQFGDYAYTTPIDSPMFGMAGGDETVDQSAWAGYLGGRYNFDTEYKPYIDLSFWYISGDDGDVDDSGGIDNEDFVSYEYVNSSMIMEDSTFGLDVDSNYWAVKFEGGFTTTTGLRPDDLAFRLFYGFFQLNEEPDRVGLAMGGPGLEIEDDLGHEVDFNITWTYNESLSMNFGAAWLWSADFFGDRTGPTSMNTGAYETGDDNMQLYTFTTDLTF